LKGVQAIRDHHGVSTRKFNSVAAATVWAQSGLGG
jgi:hypothetical protein